MSKSRPKSKPSPFRGPLTSDSASTGVATAKSNAKRLLEDAETLFQMSRFPSACGLAALAVEETSKPAIIRKILLARSADEVRRGWQIFSTHHEKAAPWIVPHLIRDDPETFEDFVESFMRQRDPQLLDSLKQLSIYCGCYGNSHWASPQDVIEKDQAQIVIAAARILTVAGQVSPLDSERGLTLWQQHMQGCFSVGYVTANDKIVEYFKVAGREGLLSSSRIPQEVAFDFMTTALVLSDNEAHEQLRDYGTVIDG